MEQTGMVQQSFSGTTHVALPADALAFVRQAAAGARYVEFAVPSSSVRQTGDAWAKILGPDALESRREIALGRPAFAMPRAFAIRWVATKLR